MDILNTTGPPSVPTETGEGVISNVSTKRSADENLDSSKRFKGNESDGKALRNVETVSVKSELCQSVHEIKKEVVHLSMAVSTETSAGSKPEATVDFVAGCSKSVDSKPEITVEPVSGCSMSSVIKLEASVEPVAGCSNSSEIKLEAIVEPVTGCSKSTETKPEASVEPVAGCSKDFNKVKGKKALKPQKVKVKKETAEVATTDDNFRKPGQVRRRLRRNAPRQKVKNGRGKFVRKRSNSFKRRKKEIRVIVPPTKFLLGGNINDPLNLNSLQDEEMNRAMNAVTPKSSPLPTPKHRRGEVEVLLPRNLKDPLHLTSATDDKEYLKQLSKKKRKRKRKRGNSSSGSGKEESFEAGVPVEEPIATVEGAFVPPDSIPPAKRELLTLTIKDAPKKRKEGLDRIVSPVVPQPGAWKRGQPRPAGTRKRKLAKSPKFNPRSERFQYGNYDRYYGYRNPNRDADPRLQCFHAQPGLFLEKDVLDIGCNIGHVTLCVARDFGARSIVGLDIDKKLIGIARKNVKHYVTVAETPVYCPSTRMATPHTPYMDSPANQSPFPHHYVPNSPAYQQSPCANSPATRQNSHPNSPANRSPFRHYYVPNSPAYEQSPSCPQQLSPSSRSPFNNASSPANATPLQQSPATESSVSRAPSPRPTHPSFFPISMPIMYGPLEVPGCGTPDGPAITARPFPHNVSFVQGSYVLESDSLLSSETAQFDVILCLSITKWIHLNWGDVGLKRAFRRMFAQLRPGGKLILEPQGWPSYNKKKALTEQIYRNYLSIELLPDKFVEYLLSPAVGFSTVEEIGAPFHSSKGFRRPIHVLTKPGQTPSSCNTPVTYTPYAQRTCVRKPVYTSLGSVTFDNDDDKKKDT